MSNPDGRHDQSEEAREDEDKDDGRKRLNEERIEGADEVSVDGDAQQGKAHLGKDNRTQGVVGEFSAADDLIANSILFKNRHVEH